MNLLFICSRNKWRSPTAESIYKNIPGLSARSAGTEPSAQIRLTAKMIAWADIIFVMEKKHKQRILEKFELESRDKEIVILDIPDEYKFMDPELIEEIKAGVNSVIERRK
jgi:predicted protein tyrosine phosphatase